MDILRRLIQDSINDELSKVIERYLHKFFDPAVANIRKNNEEVTDEHISCLCQQMLEEAEKMYVYRTTSSSATDYPQTASPLTDSEIVSGNRQQKILINKHIPSDLRKRFYREQQMTDSDAESDVSVPSSTISSHNARKRPKHFSEFYAARPPSRSSTPGVSSQSKGVPELSLEDIEKWNPDRVTSQTKFVLGSKANKALGMTAQRGRIYMKHTGLFKYVGDNDDKSWLMHQNVKAMRCGGRAFLTVLDDILDLAQTQEYRNNPDVDTSQLTGFTVPEFILEKIRSRMSSVYEINKDRLCQSREAAPLATGVDIGVINENDSHL